MISTSKDELNLLKHMKKLEEKNIEENMKNEEDDSLDPSPSGTFFDMSMSSSLKNIDAKMKSGVKCIFQFEIISY